MANSPGNSLAELLARAELRKKFELRSKLGLGPDSKIEGLELDSLGYHLTERSGRVYLILEPDGVLRVGEPESSQGLRYRNEAAEVLMKAWGVSREEARRGIGFEVVSGVRAVGEN